MDRILAITPAVSLSPASLSFPVQNLGTSSAAQPVTLTNSGTGPLVVTSITASGDFTQTSNCGGTLAVNANCTINITFTPTAAGTRTGSVSIADNATGTPQTINLTGAFNIAMMLNLRI